MEKHERIIKELEWEIMHARKDLQRYQLKQRYRRWYYPALALMLGLAIWAPYSSLKIQHLESHLEAARRHTQSAPNQEIKLAPYSIKHDESFCSADQLPTRVFGRTECWNASPI